MVSVTVILLILFLFTFLIVGFPALIALLLAKGTGQKSAKTKQWVAIGFLIGIIMFAANLKHSASDSEEEIEYQ